MIEAIIIDDERYNLEEINELVEKTGLFHVAGMYQNPLNALEEVTCIQPQVAFVDIELPEMDGITLAEKLLEMNADIIIVFITSYNQYAVKAFDLNAIDYILKPIRHERFYRMVEKIKNELCFRNRQISKTLNIKVFDNLAVTIGDIPVIWQRTKAKELFAYLLMYHDTYIHKAKIVENLWPEHEPEKALQILQTSVCKIRSLFSQIKNIVKLDYSSSTYCLRIEGGDCDFFQVEKALSEYRKDNLSTYESVEKAAELSEKGFLSAEGFLWSAEKEQYLRNSLLLALKEIKKGYIDQGFADMGIQCLHSSIKLAPFEEDSNYMLIKTYLEAGNDRAALSHYQWLEKIWKEEYEETLSERIKALMHKRK